MGTKLKKSNNDITIFSENEYNEIVEMLRDYSNGDNLEFEVSFKNINYPNFMRITEHYINITPENKIESNNYLDISLIFPDKNVYRVSLFNQEQIGEFITKFSKASSNDISRYIVSLDPSDDIEIVYKNRGSGKLIGIDNWAITIKSTEEIPLVAGKSKISKPKITGSERIMYRYKTRYSFTINKNSRIDITDVKSSPIIWKLMTVPSNYELELELINKIDINTLESELLNVFMIIQDTKIPISKAESDTVVEEYRNLLNVRQTNNLDSRNVISVNSNHIINFIPNRYAVTDKADGERYFLFSLNSGIYLLSINLTVKKLNIPVLEKRYQNMLIDGEYIKTTDHDLFMVFDVIFAEGTDYRYDNTYSLPKRIIIINNIIDKCFGNLIPFNDYTDKHNNLELDSIKTYYKSELSNYWKNFKNRLNKSTDLFITRKLYLVPYGIDSSEIFMYADMIWKLYVYNELTPYQLDGIIYTPINSPYLIRGGIDAYDTIPMEYKWKPPSQNSIDFYIRFKKDVSGADAVYYDNSVERAEGKPYKICLLYVGLNKQGQEIPIQFKVNGVEQTANIYTKDGEATDINGNAINDNTVVEFVFDTLKIDMDDSYKWIPIRTRYDKTESVQKYHKRYGNNLQIANRIWKTITNPITEDIISSLGDPTTFNKEITLLSDFRDTKYNKQALTYYQKNTSNAAGMRAFNNWIKSNMITTYCRDGSKVLDIGCGRGGDLIKFINAGVEFYVGIDIDNNGLYVINDSANNRYKNLKKTIQNIPPMYFINADARGLFTLEAQEKILPGMPDFNKSLINKYLVGNKYDTINCQFTIHYYLSDELSWNNFCKNINNQLKDNGYLLITSFDGNLIHNKLKGKQKLSSSYTDNRGNKNIFFEINKIYSDTDKVGLGMAIDLYNSLISNPGTYIREYLVFPEFLEKSLKEKCGLELVESDLFYNIFNTYKNYFKKTYNEYGMTDVSSKKHSEIREFYLSLEGNANNDIEIDIARASFKLAMLNRYYVFRKTSTINITEPSRIVNELNNRIDLGKFIMPYFRTNNMFIDLDNVDTDINRVYRNIRNKYRTTRPHVYLIKHNINENRLEDIYLSNNKLDFSKIKNGSDPKVLLIYKSPDKQFYPLYYQNYQSMPFDLDQIYLPDKKKYLLDSDRIINDLNILINLTEKIKNIPQLS
ncbi:putative mRNA-capping enzyme [Acanthamoeba polyphaga mimivirus]|uniref:Putative mRNA-capping enzyme n=1 Tax=Acanthamoeba polyphaga mimivirus TaxID=212035 RepID=A0A0G2Y5X6_MIMIV|nr:putative mRNA-capping enzyme [Acanthamoeba polyphaga mimivirus]